MFGEHAAFILPSYIISFVVLAGMTVFIRLNYSARKKELAKLEEQGVHRRAKG